MPAKSVARAARIELRTTRAEKQLLAQAAAQERLDVTSFIMRSALPAAKEVMARSDRIVLSGRDTELVLKLLERPPRPTKALIEALARYRAR